MMVPICIARSRSVSKLGRTVFVAASRHASSSEEQEEAPAVSVEPAPVNRNVSGLRPWHYRRYHGQPPVVDEETRHLTGLRFQRRIWAQYGAKSGINPAIAWPVKEEWEDKMEYEALAYPDSLQEMVRKSKEEEAAKEKVIQERMNDIEAKMANLEKWKKDIIDKKRKKEQELKAAKQKHDQMIEEVKEYLGYRVDPKDARFKEILEKKELEEKKRAKEAKKKEKQARAIARLRQMAEQVADKEKPAEGA